MKETTRITKTYMCLCGTQNMFALDTDLGIDELQAKVHCQGCGKKITIAFGNSTNGIANGINKYQNGSQPAQNGYQTAQNGCPTPNQQPYQQQSQASLAASISQSLSIFDDPIFPAPAVHETQVQRAAQTTIPLDLIVEHVEPQTTVAAEGSRAYNGAPMTSIVGTQVGDPQAQGQQLRGVQNDDARKRARSALEVYVESEEDGLSHEEHAGEQAGEEPTPEEEQALRDLFGRL